MRRQCCGIGATEWKQYTAHSTQHPALNTQHRQAHSVREIERANKESLENRLAEIIWTITITNPQVSHLCSTSFNDLFDSFSTSKCVFFLCFQLLQLLFFLHCFFFPSLFFCLPLFFLALHVPQLSRLFSFHFYILIATKLIVTVQHTNGHKKNNMGHSFRYFSRYYLVKTFSNVVEMARLLFAFGI